MNFSEFFESIGVPAFGTKVCEPVNCGAGLAIEDGISGGADDSYMVVIGDVTPKMFRDFLASSGIKRPQGDIPPRSKRQYLFGVCRRKQNHIHLFYPRSGAGEGDNR